jgi:hypothetical protein
MLLCWAPLVGADTDDEEHSEPTAIVEIGGAGEWSLANGRFSFAPNLAVEVTPIEDWLEIEVGLTPFVTQGQTQWNADLLFKKPFTLSDTVELMVGAGPEWTRGRTNNSIGCELALDLMVWPGGKRKFGWYIEPSYGFDLSSRPEHTWGLSAGLLIALP